MKDDPSTTSRGAVHNEFPGYAHSLVQAGSIVGDVYFGQRAKRLAVHLTHEPTIEAAPDWADALAAWEESERARLHALADEYDWIRNAGQSQQRVSDLGRFVFSDMRSRKTYETYVEDYLSQANDVLRQRLLLLMEEHPALSAQLTVENRTEQHFRGVELRVWFDDHVMGFSDDLRLDLPTTWPDLPPVPAPPGTSGDYLTLQRVMSAPRRLMPTLRVETNTQSVLDGWSGEVLDQSILVEFERFDLRPGQVLLLPAVPLGVLLSPGAVLDGGWDATADDADGRCSGDLALGAVESTLDLADLAEPGPPSENNLRLLDLIGWVGPAVVSYQWSRQHLEDR